MPVKWVGSCRAKQAGFSNNWLIFLKLPRNWLGRVFWKKNLPQACHTFLLLRIRRKDLIPYTNKDDQFHWICYSQILKFGNWHSSRWNTLWAVGGGGGASLLLLKLFTALAHSALSPLSPNPQKAFSALHFLHCRKRKRGGNKGGIQRQAKYVWKIPLKTVGQRLSHPKGISSMGESVFWCF